MTRVSPESPAAFKFSRLLLSGALSGALLVLSFPTWGHPLAAWVALVPLLVTMAGGAPPRLAFSAGLVAGLVHFAGMLPWLTQVMMQFGGMPRPLAMVLNGLLILYLATFPAAWATLTALLLRRFGSLALMAAAPIWLTTELARLWLLGGFPWELLGYSQTSVLPVAQLASLFGVHGVTLIVVLVNSAVAMALVAPWRTVRTPILATAGVVSAVVVFGTVRLADNRLVESGTPLRVGLVQGNIDQAQKWDPALSVSILERYLSLSRETARDGAELIVWPESATPFGFEEHPGGEAIRQLARDTGAHLLFGSTQRQQDTVARLFNAAFTLGPDGRTKAVYHKRHLVPFGEYVPLSSLLFFAQPLVESIVPFTPGTGPLTLPIGPHLMSTAICYEIIYPALVRSFVREGSQLLTTITNDAWYGRSAAPHQHFQQATMRAIEQGRYLVRAANTGISGVVDPYGRVLARSGLFETTTLNTEVRLIDGLTVYGRIGDLLAYLCLVVTLITSVGVWTGRW